ncbi:gamma-glutamylcyclotransferase family protein [Devosia sp. LC5]|uniref:gamma-glutamylcyclotransferase family protein n=1 Tax=Devosia sp. LC5 TaxID=1502724 RepID=UPI00068E7D06|nr:gamma-glutamylcyclotransferase family protein [Devosia sp. LC5]
MVLFAYGTLQDADVLASVLGRPVDIAMLQSASAPDFKAVAYPGRVYPALVPCPGAAAPGLLIGGLDRLDLAVLDAFEGDEYRRGSIPVLLDEQIIHAQAYLPAISIEPSAPAWSLRHWLANHKPQVIAAEAGTARSLRERLTSAQP